VSNVPSQKVQTSFDTLCYAVNKTIGKIPFAGEITDFACSRVNARFEYMKIRPLLIESIKRNGRENDITLHLIDEISSTANWGAARHNFTRYYIKGNKINDLPEDPNDIMFGYW